MSAENNVVPVAPRPALVAGHRPTAIVPTSMDEAYRLANAVVVAGLAPKGLETPERAMVAILAGLEVGLTPMASLQRIAVVNGRTTIWGDGAIGLVRASGLLVHMHESLQGTGDAREAVCEVLRKGEKAPVLRSFSVAQAKQANLWNKAGPWREYPERMLQMRARAFALRDVFADVLGGLYIREEIEEEAKAPSREPPPPPALTKREPPPPPPATRKEPPAPPASGRSSVPYAEMAKPAEPVEDASYVDLAGEAPATRGPDEVVDDYRNDMSAVENLDKFDEVDAAYRDAITALPPEHKAEALRIRSEVLERLG